MKRNLRTWNKALQIACLASALFLTSCKEKKYTFENPCAAPAPPIASNNSPVASGALVQFTTETVAGGAYQWSGPNGFSSTEQNPSFTFSNANQVGDYTVSVTVGGCTSLLYHSYVSSCAVAPVITTNSPAVIDSILSIETPFITDATYNWILPNMASYAGQNITKIKAALLDTGVYTLTITLKNGCTTPAVSTRMKIRPNAPKPKATGFGIAGAGAKIGVGGNLILDIPVITAYGGLATFEWYGPNNFSSSQQKDTITALTKANEGEYKVVAKINGLTSDTAILNVVVRYSNTPCGTATTVLVGTQVVKIIQIGTQCWTSENLKKVTAPPDQYLWADMMVKTTIDSQGVCPVGWHPPSDLEFSTLVNSMSVNQDGNTLKLVGQGSGAGAGTNTSGFSAKLTGGNAYFWTSTSYGSNYAWYRQLNAANNAIFRSSADNSAPLPGASDQRKKYNVRCIKD